MHRRHTSYFLPILGIVSACSSNGAPQKQQDEAAAPDTCTRAAMSGQMILEYSAGISETGAQGMKVSIVDATPAPPARGDDAWRLKIDRDGSPVAGAKLDVYPLMVAHGHSTPSAPVVKANGDGTYALSMILNMAGFWDTRVTVTSGDVTDVVHFGFCVE
jgi:hypothetical protein